VGDIITSSAKKRDKLRSERKKRKLTQKQVADYLSISVTHYSNIERGDRNPGTKVAVAISDFFGIKIKDLI
jgi:putative transcriptional regulator